MKINGKIGLTQRREEERKELNRRSQREQRKPMNSD
jgi:hypothetical protein